MDSSSNEEDRKGKRKSMEEEPNNVVNLLPERFSEGVRVIVVLDHAPLLQQVVGMLEKYSYQVTSCNNAAAALTMIQVDGNKFDLILTTANIDGFNLLESISRDQDLPVIMILNDDAKESVIECISKGACDCLISPIQEQDLKLLYKHVIPNMIKRTRNAEVGSSSGSVGKKAKLVWTTELDKKFVAAIEELGRTNVVPSKILKRMNVEGITRAQVSSHLQEYQRSHEPGLSTPNPYHNVPPMHLWSQTTGNFASYGTRSPAFSYGQNYGVRATPHSPSYIGIERPQMPHQPTSRPVRQIGQWVLPEVGSPPVEEAEFESDTVFQR